MGNIQDKSREGERQLIVAIKEANLPEVKRLIENCGVPSYHFKYYGRFNDPLCVAVAEGQLQIVEYLLERGAPPISHPVDQPLNAISREPLSEASERGMPKIIDLLLSRIPDNLIPDNGLLHKSLVDCFSSGYYKAARIIIRKCPYTGTTEALYLEIIRLQTY